jgi:hypothetical protein
MEIEEISNVIELRTLIYIFHKLLKDNAHHRKKMVVILKSHSKSLQNYGDACAPIFHIMQKLQTQVSQKKPFKCL